MSIRTWTCIDCGRMISLIPMTSEEIDKVREDIENGAYGDGWKRMMRLPNGELVTERVLYECGHCGYVGPVVDAAIYRPKTPFDKDMLKVKSFVHKCPECGKRTRRVKDVVHCPGCKAVMVEESL